MEPLTDSMTIKSTTKQTLPTAATAGVTPQPSDLNSDDPKLKTPQNDKRIMKITKKKVHSTSVAKNMKGIKNHRKIAGYLQVATKKHLEAAIHYQDGNQQKAIQSALIAQTNFNLADKAQKKHMNLHPIEN